MKPDNLGDRLREPVMDPDYWKARLEKCDGEIHRAMFRGSIDQLLTLELIHRRQIHRVVDARTSVLDAGCGYGRALELMPDSWVGEYLGLDISPDFLNVAKEHYPHREFVLWDLRKPYPIRDGKKYDIGLCLWFESMLYENDYREEWFQIEQALLESCHRIVTIS